MWPMKAFYDSTTDCLSYFNSGPPYHDSHYPSMLACLLFLTLAKLVLALGLLHLLFLILEYSDCRHQYNLLIYPSEVSHQIYYYRGLLRLQRYIYNDLFYLTFCQKRYLHLEFTDFITLSINFATFLFYLFIYFYCHWTYAELFCISKQPQILGDLSKKRLIILSSCYKSISGWWQGEEFFYSS